MTIIAARSLTCLVLTEAQRLNEILRLGWGERGVQNVDVENDLDHSLRLHRVVTSIPRRIRGMKKERMAMMALIHDFDELILGDEIQRGEVELPFREDPKVARIAETITDSRTREQRMASAIKLVAFQSVISEWPMELQPQALEIYSEYTFAWSNEAKAVHQCHPIVNLEQGLDYIAGNTKSGERYPDIDLDTFWDDAFAASQWLDTPIDLVPRLSQIRELEREFRSQTN